MKRHLLIIDPQEDFCNPRSGALFVAGAEADISRIAVLVQDDGFGRLPQPDFFLARQILSGKDDDRQIAKRWFRLKIKPVGTAPVVTCWAVGYLVQRLR